MRLDPNGNYFDAQVRNMFEWVSEMINESNVNESYNAYLESLS